MRRTLTADEDLTRGNPGRTGGPLEVHENADYIELIEFGASSTAEFVFHDDIEGWASSWDKFEFMSEDVECFASRKDELVFRSEDTERGASSTAELVVGPESAEKSTGLVVRGCRAASRDECTCDVELVMARPREGDTRDDDSEMAGGGARTTNI